MLRECQEVTTKRHPRLQHLATVRQISPGLMHKATPLHTCQKKKIDTKSRQVAKNAYFAWEILSP